MAVPSSLITDKCRALSVGGQ